MINAIFNLGIKDIKFTLENGTTYSGLKLALALRETYLGYQELKTNQEKYAEVIRDSMRMTRLQRLGVVPIRQEQFKSLAECQDALESWFFANIMVGEGLLEAWREALEMPRISNADKDKVAEVLREVLKLAKGALVAASERGESYAGVLGYIQQLRQFSETMEAAKASVVEETAEQQTA